MIAPLVAAIERIDDIPLLLAQMKKLQLAELLDKEFPRPEWQAWPFFYLA
ncbi:hypothetical protein [Legionella santicrucis]|nr:hypothetical protein [Legionella santicrucis]